MGARKERGKGALISTQPRRRVALERWAAHIEGLVTGKRGDVVPMQGRPQ